MRRRGLTLKTDSESDTFSVKTNLRPDIFELVTFFSYDQLRQRSEFLPFHLATLLNPYNIKKYCKIFGVSEYYTYLRSSYDHKRTVLRETLESVGITHDSAEAVTFERQMFVPPGRKPFSYLNVATSVLGDTNISSPTIVGYMLDATKEWTGRTTVEIGIGTGLHSIALAKLHSRMTVLGVERNREMHHALADNVSQVGLEDRISVIDEVSRDEWLLEANNVYLTAAASLEATERLVALGGPDTEWLLPRQLTEEEFSSESDTSWLKRRFGSYAQYKSDDDWNLYCALESFYVDLNMNSRRRSIIYDTSFVKFIE